MILSYFDTDIFPRHSIYKKLVYYIYGTIELIMIKRIVVLLLFVCVCSDAVTAQVVNSGKLDSFFNAIEANNKGMGSVAIMKNGAIQYQKAIGYSDLGGNIKIPATEKTKYRIGSISKMFTATMIFQLIDEGEISLGTTLDSYFPQVPNAQNITIGDMLSHRSGIHNFTADSSYLTWMLLPQTEEMMLQTIARNKIDFEPGTKTEYSNTNFLLLGYILEKIWNKPYKELLKERITDKIGLEDTYYGGIVNTTFRESHSYSYESTWQQSPETDMSVPGGAGAVVSTPTDLAKFITALFDGKLVSKESLGKMKAMNNHLGMGMFQFPFGTKKIYGHNGRIDDFEAMLGYIPADGVAVAYCSNGVVYPENDIMIGALSIYYDIPYSIPTFKTVAVSVTDLDKYVGIYSNATFPLKVTITRSGNTLRAQATGQSSFQLEAQGNDKFKFDAAGIELTFKPAMNEMSLLQGGRKTVFTKEK